MKKVNWIRLIFTFAETKRPNIKHHIGLIEFKDINLIMVNQFENKVSEHIYNFSPFVLIEKKNNDGRCMYFC